VSGCKKEEFNNSTKLKHNETLIEKMVNSSYDWLKRTDLSICISSPKDGTITVNALNGEIIYSGYLLNGVLNEYVLKIPTELSHVIIEHAGFTKMFEVNSNGIEHEFK
jgi:hypothetical protein